MKIILALVILITCISLKSQEIQHVKRKNRISQNVSDTIISVKPENLTKSKFIKEIWDYYTFPAEWKFIGDKPAIIDFYADWCKPCKIAEPILEEVYNEYSGKIRVYKIDTQTERELSSLFGISALPAFLYIPVSGRPFIVSGIGRTKEETKQMFIDNIKSYLSVN